MRFSLFLVFISFNAAALTPKQFLSYADINRNTTCEMIYNRLGSPLNERYTNTTINLEYAAEEFLCKSDSLSLVSFAVSNDINSSRLGALAQIFGKTKFQTRIALGAPARTDNTRFTYRIHENNNHTANVNFYFRNNVVTSYLVEFIDFRQELLSSEARIFNEIKDLISSYFNYNNVYNESMSNSQRFFGRGSIFRSSGRNHCHYDINWEMWDKQNGSRVNTVRTTVRNLNFAQNVSVRDGNNGPYMYLINGKTAQYSTQNSSGSTTRYFSFQYYANSASAKLAVLEKLKTLVDICKRLQ